MENTKIDNVNNKTTTLWVVLLTALMTTFSGSALNLSIPAIDNEFNAGAVIIGWVINGYILAGAALSVPIGRLADLTNRENILKVGILIFSLSAGAICFVNSIELFVFLRVLQGIGGAMIFATNQAVLISNYPAEKRGKVLGYLIGATYIGLTTGPVLGGFLNHWFGWRSIMLLTFIIGMLAFILALKVLHKTTSLLNGKQKMDYAGSIMFVLIIVGLMYGLSAFSTEAYAKYMILSAIILFAFFIRHELKAESPIIEISLFRKNIGYSLSNLAALLNYGATFAVGYLMSIYLQIIRDFDSHSAGLILISQPLIMALLSPYAGRLSDRISPHKLASLGMGLCALGLFLFIFVTEDLPIPLIILNLSIVGLGFAFFSSPNTNAIMSYVEPKDYGVASSILATMRNLGHSSNMAVVTFIVSIFLGSTPLNNADIFSVMRIMKVSFLFFTVLCIIGVIISLKRNNS